MSRHCTRWSVERLIRWDSIRQRVRTSGIANCGIIVVCSQDQQRESLVGEYNAFGGTDGRCLLLQVRKPAAPGGANKRTAFQHVALARTLGVCFFQGEKPAAIVHRQNLPSFVDPATAGEDMLQVPDSIIALAATIVCFPLLPRLSSKTTRFSGTLSCLIYA